MGKSTKDPGTRKALDAAAFSNGRALHQAGRLDEAEAHYRSVLESDPRHFEALSLLGTIFLQRGNFEEADRLIGLSLRIDPKQPAALINRACALKELGRFDEALSSCDMAITLSPGNADAHYNRGIALKELGRLEEALKSYARAIKLRPGYAAAYNNQGNALKDIGRFDEALASYNRAIALRPDDAAAHNNLGTALKELGRLEDALKSYDIAIALRPDYADAYNNRGNTLKELRRFDEALKSYDRAIALRPGFANAHWNKGLAKLMLGDFEEGLRLYEWRWKTDDFIPAVRSFPHPLWQGGEGLEGRTVFLYAEQGLGDTIQFCRYTTLISGQGARVVLEVQQTLKPLMSSLDGADEIIARGEPVPPFDLHCPLLSLPYAFKTRLENIPATVPYLKARPEDIGRWSQKLGQKNKLRAGMVWSGSLLHKNDRFRSIPLARLLTLSKCGVELISLQKDLRPGDEAALKDAPQARHFGKELADFSDTAALVSLLDLVITVDTSVAHLAGAMGKPVWILLPFIGTDWRWMTEREDSPWYPSARLFRQGAMDDWESVISRVKTGLETLAARSGLNGP